MSELTLGIIKPDAVAANKFGNILQRVVDSGLDRKSTRLNSSHSQISYAVFCLKKKNVHCADALEYDFTRFPPGMRIVGNLPYNISTPPLFHLTRFAQRVRDLHFMLQLEVVERMVAAPSTAAYGRLSVALQARFRMRKLFKVSKEAFRPPPKVESAVVRMEPLSRILEIDEQLLRRAFSARRKTLRNALPEI